MRGAIIGGIIGCGALVALSIYKGEGGSIEYMISYLAGGTIAGACIGYLMDKKRA